MTVLSFLDHQYLQSIGSLATAVGVLLAAFQLRRSKLQAITAFEDDLAKEYRDICNKIPTRVFLGETLSPEEMAPLLDDFYRYFDLSNSQVFFRKIGRVSEKTWTFWADGMNANLALAGFSMAWSQIGPRIGNSFLEFKRLVEEGFSHDPKHWYRG